MALKSHPNIKSLYVHIPFCSHICHYCDYAKMFYNVALADRYLDKLLIEIESFQIDQYQTIYIGGGTPSALNVAQLSRLLAYLDKKIAPDGEFTIEVNVENFDLAKLIILNNSKVNRISVGVQTFNDRYLKMMNRHHNAKQALDLIKLIKSYPRYQLSVDLIFDLPLQTKKQLIDDLQTIINLNVNHVSLYPLTIHPNTVFAINKVPQASDDKSRDHYDLIYQMLTQAGFHRYEISNFAKDGQVGRHNLTYWNNEYYAAAGLAASGYLANIRYKNTMNMTSYLSGVTMVEQEKITLKEAEQYYLMLKLRLAIGFSLSDFQKRFNHSFLEKYRQSFDKLSAGGLLYERNQSIMATYDGLMLLDSVIIELLKEE